MAKYYRRYKVSGTVKFCVDDVPAEAPQDVESFLREDLVGNLEVAYNQGTLELVELSEVEDVGLSDLEIED